LIKDNRAAVRFVMPCVMPCVMLCKVLVEAAVHKRTFIP